MSEEVPVALITGGARRIGAAIVRRLHARGYAVAVHCRTSVSERDALLEELESARSRSTLGLQAELADHDALPALVQTTLERFGRLDALVNNASAFFPTPLAEATCEHWETLMASNARAPLFLSQAAAPHLRAAHGAIVNLIDLYAERPLAQHSIYCMAKAALAMMTRALARELAPEIRVNGIAPGAILWPEGGNGYTDRETLIAQTPLKRTGEPEDIADAVLWLLRDAGFVTGQIINIDGGRSIVP